MPRIRHGIGDAVNAQGRRALTVVASLGPAYAWKGARSGGVDSSSAVAEYLRREIEREPGEDPVGVRVRVSGTWEHGYLKQERWAIRATSVERLPSP